MLDPFEFSVLVSNIGDTKPVLLAILLVSVILFYFKKYQESSILIMSTVLATAVTFILKHIFKIPRPDTMLIAETGYRFPSGHATTAGLLLGFYFLVIFKKVESKFWRALLGVLIMSWFIAVCFARLYLHVHIFVDVVMGGLIGVMSVAFSAYVYNRYRRSR